jgi:hypothetical protein
MRRDDELDGDEEIRWTEMRWVGDEVDGDEVGGILYF